MVEMIFGVALILVGTLLFRSFSLSGKKMEAMESTETSTVEFLNDLSQSMAEGVGAGSFRYASEVKGKVVCPEPLISELAQVECVHYSMKVQRRYEETYDEKGRDGHQERKTRTCTETVASNTRSIPFHVDDGTGRIKINPGSAEFITEKVLSRFETTASESEKRFSIGSVAIDPVDDPQGSDRRTIGYRFEENAILVGKEVYVLGEATDRGGELRIGWPGEGGKFIISVKSEAELLQDERSSATWKLIGATVCGALGITALLMAIF